MEIDIHKLEAVVHRSDGRIIARCPACAEEGRDRTGNHLIVYPDGRFSCVVYPGEEGREHRKLVFKLAGERLEKPGACAHNAGWIRPRRIPIRRAR